MLLHLLLAGIVWGAADPICTPESMVDYAAAGKLDLIVTCPQPIEPDVIRDSIIAAACGNHLAVVNHYLRMGAVMTRDRQDVQCAAGMGYDGTLTALLANQGEATELTQALLLAASNGHIRTAEILTAHGAKPTDTVYCYKPIKWAPRGMYDRVAAKLPTCSEFIKKVVADRRREYPGMGLLEDPEDEKRRKAAT